MSGKRRKTAKVERTAAPVARKMLCPYCQERFFAGAAASHRRVCARAREAYERSRAEERVRLAKNVKKRGKPAKKKKKKRQQSAQPTANAAGLKRSAPAVDPSPSRQRKKRSTAGVEACAHYQDRRHCPICGPRRRAVYITSGGWQRFHLDRACPYLARGQEQVRQRGGVTSPIEAVAPDSHRRLLGARTPCKGCADPYRDRQPDPPRRSSTSTKSGKPRPRGAVIESDPWKIRSHEHPCIKK